MSCLCATDLQTNITFKRSFKTLLGTLHTCIHIVLYNVFFRIRFGNLLRLVLENHYFYRIGCNTVGTSSD